MKDLIRKLNTARSMPPSILAETLANLAKRKIRRYYIKIFPVKLPDKRFLNATGYKTIDEFLNRNQPYFFFNLDDKERIVETIRKEYPESIEQTINDADEICEHIFDLLGSGKTGIQKPITSGLESMSP